jgi:hypothetical protein
MDGLWQPATDDIELKILPEISDRANELLRDEDIIGTLNMRGSKNVFIILPMTDSIGANVVKKKLYSKFEDTNFEFNDTVVKINLVISAATYDREKTAYYLRYIKLVKKQHAGEKERIESFT